MTEEESRKAENFWKEKDRKSKHMDRDELAGAIDEFLSSHKLLALAAGSSDFIRCTPLEYAWHDGALWIFTEGGLKFRAIRENKQVSAAVFEMNPDFGGLKSMQIQGTVEIADLFSDEYCAAAEFKKIPLETLKKLPEAMWLLKIVPDEITFLNSDFKKDGYGSRQTWKREDADE